MVEALINRGFGEGGMLFLLPMYGFPILLAIFGIARRSRASKVVASKESPPVRTIERATRIEPATGSRKDRETQEKGRVTPDLLTFRRHDSPQARQQESENQV
ncbi:MAG: hypothetical protein ACM3SU_00725 [Acidobacteriota bacterium]